MGNLLGKTGAELAKRRTIIKTLPDGSTEVKTSSSSCLGTLIAWVVGISLLIWAIVSPLEYPWWEALLTYLALAGFIALVIWAYVRQKRKPPVNKANAPDVQSKPTPNAQPRLATVAEARFELANYGGGLPSHPKPEAKGTLILPGSGPTFGRWELHWAAGADLATQHQMIYGGLARYRLMVEATGPTSCRATISDRQDPAIIEHFDLPNTTTATVKAALVARAKVIESGRRSPTLANNKSPDAMLSAPSSRLGIADELAKLADLHAKGVLSDANSPHKRRDSCLNRAVRTRRRHRTASVVPAWGDPLSFDQSAMTML